MSNNKSQWNRQYAEIAPEFLLFLKEEREQIASDMSRFNAKKKSESETVQGTEKTVEGLTEKSSSLDEENLDQTAADDEADIHDLLLPTEEAEWGSDAEDEPDWILEDPTDDTPSAAAS